MHGAIILCGGQSARMGRDKATLPFGPDEALLQRVVRLVAEAVSPTRIICVASQSQVLPPLDVQTIRDSKPHSGPLAGLATGLTAQLGNADAVFACGCDIPLLVPAFATRMFDLLGDHQIAAPHDGERFHPLAAVYRTDVLPLAESLLAAGKRSLVSLLDACDTHRVPVEALREVDPDLLSLASCNTPDDCRRALRKSGFPV